MGEDYVTGELENVLDSPDVDANEGIRPNSLVFEGIGDGARAIVGDEGSTKSCFTDSVAQVRSTVATVASLLMTPGQLKLVLGNLQINAYVKTDTIQPRRVASLSLALSRSLWLTLYHCCLRYTYSYRSLTVVFNIPWPPVHMRFINFLSVFKLDLFKGLSFMAPCLHSSHFMSLASFVVAVRTCIVFYRDSISVLTSSPSSLPPAAAHHSRRFRSRPHHPLRCTHCAQAALLQRTTRYA